MSYLVNNWKFDADLGLNARIEHLESKYAPVDTMTHEMRHSNYEIVFSPSVLYDLGKKLKISVRFPVSYLRTSFGDRKESDFLIKPYLYVNGLISRLFNYAAGVRYTRSKGAIYDLYDGSILTDYRTFNRKEGIMPDDRTQSYFALLEYVNDLSGMVGAIRSSYSRKDKNVLYGMDVDEEFNYQYVYRYDNHTDAWSVRANLDKRFVGIATTLSLNGEWSKSQGDVLRLKNIIPVRSNQWRFGIEVDSDVSKFLKIAYHVAYVNTKNRMHHHKEFSRISSVHQRLSVDCIFLKHFTLNGTAEHYFNSAIDRKNRNSLYVDIGLSYKKDRLEVLLLGRNLLNQDRFYYDTISEINRYTRVYNLRPFSWMLKFKYTLR